MWVQTVPGGVRAIAYSSDGGTLFTLDGGGWVTAWDVPSRAPRRLTSVNFLLGSVYGLYPLAGGQQLTVRTGVKFFIRNSATGDLIASTTLPELGEWMPARVCPDGRIFYLARNCRALVGGDLRAPDCQSVLPLQDLRSPALGFDLTPDGQTLAVLFSNGGPAVLYEVAKGTELRDPTPVRGVGRMYRVQIAPDGLTLVVVSLAPDQLALWDVPSRTMRRTGLRFSADLETVVFHPSAPVFAALDPDRALALFRLDTGEPIRSFDFGLGRSVRCVAFSPDGLTCAAGGSNKKFVVFDVDV